LGELERSGARRQEGLRMW